MPHPKGAPYTGLRTEEHGRVYNWGPLHMEALRTLESVVHHNDEWNAYYG